jgi:hypothetical protein
VSLGTYFCGYDTSVQIGDSAHATYFLGYICASKTSASVRNLYEANSTTSHFSAASNNSTDGAGHNAVPTGNLYVFASNEGGTTTSYYPGRLSFVSFSSGLSASDSLALYNAVQAFRTALGGGYI